MSRLQVRTLGLFAMVVFGSGLTSSSAFGQQQGWLFQPNQGRPTYSNYSGDSSQPSRPIYYTAAAPVSSAPIAISNAIPAVVTPTATTSIEVRVPTSAKLYFDGAVTTPTGMVRNFVASPLVVGQQYHYAVRAEWNDGSRSVERTRDVSFVGGQPVTIDFAQSMSLVNH
jgi:uncharacterized protein (TIGR03000 family)